MANADLGTGLALLIIVVGAVARWMWDKANDAAGLPFPLRPPRRPPPPPPAPPPLVVVDATTTLVPPSHRNGTGAASRNGH